MIPYRIVLAVVAALLLQLSLLSDFSYEGARPEIVVLIVLAAGHLLGPDDGLVVGFAAGLAYDVFLTTPLGYTALVYLGAGYAMGRFVPPLREAPWWFAAIVLAAASAFVMLVQGALGELIGLDTLRGPAIGTIMMVVALTNLVFAPAASALVRWSHRSDRPQRRRSVYA